MAPAPSGAPASPDGLHVAHRAVLLAAALVAGALLFHELLTLTIAVVITIIIAIPLSAAASRLERHRVPRALGAAVALLGGLACVGAVGAVVIPVFAQEAERFVESVPAIWDGLRERIRDLTGAQPGEVGERVQRFLERYTEDPMRLIGPLASIGLGLAGVLAALVVVLMTAYFIAANPRPLVRGALHLVPPARRGTALDVMEQIRAAWVGWLQGVAIDMVVTGVLLYAGLAIVGLDFAVVFAVVAALLVVVPFFGAIAGAIPPVLYALTISPGKALVVLAIYVVVQQIESNITVPVVMSRTVQLHPAVIAIGVVIVGQLLGIVGLFVAVPLIAAVQIVVRELWVKPMAAADPVSRAPPDAPAATREEPPPADGERNGDRGDGRDERERGERLWRSRIAEAAHERQAGEDSPRGGSPG